MSHERVPPDEADIPDDIPCGDGVIEVWTEDGEWYGADEHGEFSLTTGSPHPVTADELQYEPCNCVLKFTFKRYGERRYCTGMAGSNFGLDFDTCKHHKCRRHKDFMKSQAEKFVHGAFAQSHESLYQFMAPHKRLIANELYKSLLSQSKFEFNEELIDLEVNVSDTSFGGENDTLVMKHPIPNDHKIQCKALWFAALDFISMESMREEQFREAAESENVDAVGERWTVVAAGEDGPVYDKDEHHLNLPLSRLQKDYRRHLEFGGVLTEEDDTMMGGGQREYVLEVVPDETDVAPEAKRTESSPVMDIAPDDE